MLSVTGTMRSWREMGIGLVKVEKRWERTAAMFPPAEEPDRARREGFMGREWWVGWCRMERSAVWQSFGAVG